MRYPVSAACALAGVFALHPAAAVAQQWTEVKSPHFVVISSASQGQTRTLVWQLEQIRSAMAALFPWARVDLDRPIAVLAVGDERGMRSLAPEYFERKGGVRPASVWVGGADRYYFAIRADIQMEDRDTINPHINAYFSYASLVVDQSVPARMPEWFTRGFAGVLSNTIVRESEVLVGPPIPWHLERLRERSRLRVAALMNVSRASREFQTGEGLARFDAQAWALVHFLMFGEGGKHRPLLDRFTKLVAGGTAPDAAVREAFGSIDELEVDYVNYINRSIFTYHRFDVDASVKRESFPSRRLTPEEAAAVTALFHVAMQRTPEARAAIAAAGKGGAAPPDSHLAEALLLDREGKTDEARAAYERAVQGGSTSAYAHYRLAALLWRPQADAATLAALEPLLLKALSLNNRHAWTNALLGELRSVRGSGEGLPFARRAIGLEPRDARHRLTAARILARQRAYDAALEEVQAAITLAEPGAAWQEAEALRASIERARASQPQAAGKPAPTPSAVSAGATEPVRLGPGIDMPRLAFEAKPTYTAEALRMQVTGVIHVEAVVSADGAVESAKVAKCDLTSRLQDSTKEVERAQRERFLRTDFKAGTCDETFGLADEAVRTVKKWRFKPATKAGTPVPVIVEIEMSFTLD